MGQIARSREEKKQRTPGNSHPLACPYLVASPETTSAPLPSTSWGGAERRTTQEDGWHRMGEPSTARETAEEAGTTGAWLAHQPPAARWPRMALT